MPSATAAVADGIWVTYGYDTRQNLTSVTYADGSGFDYAYADPLDAHNLTEKRNKAGHLINTWAYDGLDRCVGNFSVQGRGVSIDYVNDRRVAVTDAYGVLRLVEPTNLLYQDVKSRRIMAGPLNLI